MKHKLFRIKLLIQILCWLKYSVDIGAVSCPVGSQGLGGNHERETFSLTFLITKVLQPTGFTVVERAAWLLIKNSLAVIKQEVIVLNEVGEHSKFTIGHVGGQRYFS